MTYEEASRLLTMLQMNFAAFMPQAVDAAAMKKGLWARELQKYTYADGSRAVQDIITTLHYPPTMADLHDYLGTGGEMTRDDMLARIPTDIIGDPNALYSSYERDKDRIDRMFDDLDQELSKYKNMPDIGERPFKAGRSAK